jgi:hypothetical protein
MEPNGTIVLRKPQPPKPGAVIYGRSLDIDPEPFRVIARTGNMVGMYFLLIKYMMML